MRLQYPKGFKSGTNNVGDYGGALTHDHDFTGSALGNHGHAFTGDALATHDHTFTGDALATHQHAAASAGTPAGVINNSGAPTLLYNTNIAGGKPVFVGNALANHQHDAITAGTPSGTVVAKTAGTPSGSNANASAGTPAGSISAENHEPQFCVLHFIIKT